MKTIKTGITTLCIFASLFAAAQSETVTVKSTDDMNNQLSSNTKYAFSEFTFGTVYFKNAPIASGKLNYNYISNTMQFLDGKEIKDVADQKNIMLVEIGTDRFVRTDKGFGQIIFETEDVSLVHYKQIILNEKRDLGYGGKSSTASVQNVTALDSKGYASDGASTTLSEIPKDVNITVIDHYYLQKDMKTIPANKKGFYKYFHDFADEIDQYIAAHNVKFTSENDIKQLMIYLNGLPKKANK